MTNEELVLLYQHADEKKRYIEQLYNQNTGLIRKIANRYSAYSDYDDLLQESYFGLVSAANTWKENSGAVFSTYAVMMIKAHLIRYIEKNCGAVILPSHLRQKISQMKRIMADHYKATGRKLTTEELAIRMRLSEKQINNIIEGALFLNVKSTNEPINADEDSLTLEETIEDTRDAYTEIDDALEHEQLKSILWGIIDNYLEPDQAAVIHARYEHNTDSKTIAESLDVSMGQLRNIEAKAFRELRKPHIRKKLSPFIVKNSRYYSIGLMYSGYHYFMNNWTSAQEKYILLSEERK